ncbi:MAG: hypothetical protein MI923_08565 [Phycisphaerales bacterium]|nr:hypothetical protein [Phycisphaerales bacterium]
MPTKSSYKTNRFVRLSILTTAMLTPCLGCIQFAALLANLQGGEVIEEEFTLTEKPLLILIDDPNSLITQPKAIRELHLTISTNFTEWDVNHRIIPLREVQRLEQSERNFGKMSIREIGEKLGADQVLYIRVYRFTLEGEPGAPLFKGAFDVRVKVVSTERTAEVRLWPREQAGRLVQVSTDPTSMGGDKSATEIASELGIRLGRRIAAFFYEHRAFDDR